jgi:hypothetical protein
MLVFGNAEVSSPNMSMPIPTVGVTKGPAYAADINNSLLIIDKHNHTPGNGVPITPSGLNISSDLICQNNNVTNIRASRFSSQASPISAVSPDIGEIYVSGNDLYYNDGAGNQIRMTQSGSVSGSAGTITGLPSGTASASFAGGSGTFTFLQATSTAANIDGGTYILRYPGSYPTPSGNYIALQAPATLSSGYALTFPNALPGATGIMQTDTSGNITNVLVVDNSTLQNTGTILKVKDSGITNAKLAALSVATGNIQDNAVTGAKLATQSVSGNSFGAGTGQIVNNTITSADIFPGGIQTASLANNAVTRAKLANPPFLFTAAGVTLNGSANQTVATGSFTGNGVDGCVIFASGYITADAVGGLYTVTLSGTSLGGITNWLMTVPANQSTSFNVNTFSAATGTQTVTVKITPYAGQGGTASSNLLVMGVY